MSSPTETVFAWAAPPLRFGVGAADETGHECAQLDLRHVLVVTDAGVASTGAVERVEASLRAAGVRSTTYDGVHTEPTDASLRAAVEFAAGTDWSGFVAVGGGSVIDTAKAVNLMTTHPGDVLDYVNAPVGRGLAPTGPLKPLVALPTTAGTGSESTGVCVVDLLGLRLKSGISHPRLRPTLAIVDPALTIPLPPHVTACSGMDVLCHALESYTARPFTAAARSAPGQRAGYAGANPISDAFVEKAVPLVARSLRRACLQGAELSARADMMLAATFAGMGFGNAGVHIPHACAYPIAGRVRDYQPPDYPATHPMVPHGEAVAVTAPEAFRFTFAADPERHLRAARWLDPAADDVADRRERLPWALTELMRDIGMATDLGALGYAREDVPDLVEGALRQQRLLRMAPRPVSGEDLHAILRGTLARR